MNPRPFRSFAVIPAAGASRRMGVDKLVLPIGGVPMIERVLSNWKQSRVDEAIVVLDSKNPELMHQCRGTGAIVLAPRKAPNEMKHSVQVALRFIQAEFDPQPDDVWLLAPADMPRITPHLIDQLIGLHNAPNPTIIVPRCNGKNGHPTLFPWSYVPEVYSLNADQGINSLLKRFTIRYFETADQSILDDIDTPSDYQRY